MYILDILVGLPHWEKSLYRRPVRCSSTSLHISHKLWFIVQKSCWSRGRYVWFTLFQRIRLWGPTVLWSVSWSLMCNCLEFGVLIQEEAPLRKDWVHFKHISQSQTAHFTMLWRGEGVRGGVDIKASSLPSWSVWNLFNQWNEVGTFSPYNPWCAPISRRSHSSVLQSEALNKQSLAI